MALPELREYESGTAFSGKKNLRLYRNAILESGKNTGDKGSGTASVDFKCK